MPRIAFTRAAPSVKAVLRPRRIAALSLLAVAAAVTAGCVVVPARQPYYDAGAGYYGGTVAMAPPAPQQEYIGVPPVAGYIWIGGFWNWVGGRHEWVGGHWDAPRQGQRWVPHRWEPVGSQWRLAPGHWEHAR